MIITYEDMIEHNGHILSIRYVSEHKQYELLCECGKLMWRAKPPPNSSGCCSSCQETFEYKGK